MKAAVIKIAGVPENIQIEERPVPTPAEGWVLIKVKAFGLNRSELMTRKGLSPSVKFPRVLGIECVGEVQHDPTGEFKPGQKVAAFMGAMGRDFDGSYAEFTVLPKSLLSVLRAVCPGSNWAQCPKCFKPYMVPCIWL